MAWFVYLARCADDSLYCGIARDVAERIAEHDAGTGAKYTRSRGPLTVVLTRRCRLKGFALRLEYAIKQLTRAEKQRLSPATVEVLAKGLRKRRATRAGRAASDATPARARDRGRAPRPAAPAPR